MLWGFEPLLSVHNGNRHKMEVNSLVPGDIWCHMICMRLIWYDIGFFSVRVPSHLPGYSFTPLAWVQFHKKQKQLTSQWLKRLSKFHISNTSCTSIQSFLWQSMSVLKYTDSTIAVSFFSISFWIGISIFFLCLDNCLHYNQNCFICLSRFCEDKPILRLSLLIILVCIILCKTRTLICKYTQTHTRKTCPIHKGNIFHISAEGLAS